MRMCALASFEQVLSSRGYRNRTGCVGGSFSLTETLFIGRWTVWPVSVPQPWSRLPQGQECRRVAKWRGVVTSAIPRLYSLYSLYSIVLVYTMCTMLMLVPYFFIGRSILVIWNACYNTGNKSMRGPFDLPMQVTNNNTAVLNAMAVSHSRTIAIWQL